MSDLPPWQFLLGLTVLRSSYTLTGVEEFCIYCYLFPCKRVVIQPYLWFKVISGNAAADPILSCCYQDATHSCSSWHLVLNLYFRTTFRRSNRSDGRGTDIIRGRTSCEFLVVWTAAAKSYDNWVAIQPRPSDMAIGNRPPMFAPSNIQHILAGCPPDTKGLSCHTVWTEYCVMTLVFKARL